MKTFLKISGLAIIGFIVVVMVGTDYWLKKITVSSLENVTGAEVNIENVSLGLIPLSFKLEQVQLTDPSQPENNQLQLATANGDLAFQPLLSGKFIVEELQINQVQFNQARQSPGQVYRQPETDSSPSPFADLSVADIDTLLEKSPLKTTAAVQNAQALYQKYHPQLKQQYDQLPKQADLAQYQVQIKRLLDTDYKDPTALANAQEQLKTIKKAIRVDREKYSQFYQNLTEANQQMQGQFQQLKQAPQEDYQLLQGLVSGDTAALEQITQSVFGPEISKWSKHLLTAYNLLSSGEKSDTPIVEEVTDTPSLLPALWIKQAAVSFLVKGQDIQSQWQHISSDNQLIKQPATYNIDSQGGTLWKGLSVTGLIDTGSGVINGKQSWQLDGLNLSDYPLIAQSKLAVELTSALLNSTGEISIINNQLSGQSSLVMPSLALKAEGQNQFTQAMASALQQVKQLDANLNVSGSLNQPSISVSSNLDQQLKQSLLSSVSGDEQQKLAELKSKLQKKAATALSNPEFSGWQNWHQDTQAQSGQMDKLLDSQLSDVLKQQKNRLIDKLKGKLFN